MVKRLQGLNEITIVWICKGAVFWDRSTALFDFMKFRKEDLYEFI
jgi:hypothetical protein